MDCCDFCGVAFHFMKKMGQPVFFISMSKSMQLLKFYLSLVICCFMSHTRIWRRHLTSDYMLGAQGRDLYRATPAVTRGFFFFLASSEGLSHLVASYDT
jgi:hypothetical protein